MKPIFLRSLLIGTVFGSCTYGMITAAHAQSTTSGATQGLATINVVARKKTENLQKVPLSITAISAKTLQQAHVENLHDIAALTPGVFVSDFGAESGTAITIRGVSDLTSGVGAPDVATFLDGIYLRDPAAINVSAIPLSDVEITKNPSSALYGRAAYTGVITYKAARPTTTPHADISETAGDFGKSELKGDISGPIFGDVVLGEIYGDYDTFGGTYKDKISGATGGSYQKKDLGAALDVNWASNISTHVDIYYGDDVFGNTAVETLTPNCGPEPQPALVNGVAALVSSNSLYCGLVKTNGKVNIASTSSIFSNPGNARRIFYGSGNTQATFDWGTLEWLSGASQIDERAYQQFDAASKGGLFPLVNNGTNTLNGNYVFAPAFYGGASQTANLQQELRYSSPQNLPIRGSAGGAFYSETRFEYSDASFADGGVPAGQQVYSPFGGFGINDTATWGTPTGAPGPNYNQDVHTTDEESAFADLSGDILPTLTVSSEYRYTWSLQNFSEIRSQYSGSTEYPLAAADHIQEKNQYFTSDEAIKWQFLPQDMVYFAFANGVKPGGYNGASTAAADDAFGPESDVDYEGGLKSTLLDNRLELDGAIYHIDTQNVQTYGPGSDPTNVATVIKNFGATSNTGFEIDARALPLDGLTVTAGFNYNNPTFNSNTFDAADTGYCAIIPSCAAKEVPHKGLLEIPIAGNAVPYSSKYTFSGELEYDWLAADEYPAYVRADASYRSSVYTNPAELTELGAATDLDAFAGISKGRYTLSVYVKNITNDETPVEEQSQVQLSNFQNVPTVDLAQGRTFAFTVAAKF
jgi:iron complex outermembrane receptor protein